MGFLVLTRRIDEEIKIGENVYVKVLAVNGRQVKLGIEAPIEIPIHRAECAHLYEDRPSDYAGDDN